MANSSRRSMAIGRASRPRSARRSRARRTPRARQSRTRKCSARRATAYARSMMIRAYRMRGHLHANLDPLGLEPRPDHVELHPSSYGFEESDWDRKIFIDHVLGLEFATIHEMLALLRRTYCSTIGFEFMHISDPAAKAWIQQRIEGPDKEIAFTDRGQARDPEQARRSRRLREVPRCPLHRYEALWARWRPSRWCRRSNRSSNAAVRSGRKKSSSAWRIAAA